MVVELRRLAVHLMRPHPDTSPAIGGHEPVGIRSTGPGVNIRPFPLAEEVRPGLVHLTRLERLRRRRFRKIDNGLTWTAVVYQNRRVAGHHIIPVSDVDGKVVHDPGARVVRDRGHGQRPARRRLQILPGAKLSRAPPKPDAPGFKTGDAPSSVPAPPHPKVPQTRSFSSVSRLMER